MMNENNSSVGEKKRRSLGVYVVNESRESSNRLTINPKSDTSCAQNLYPGGYLTLSFK